MKKIYLFLALTAGLLVSCDMDKEPYGSLKDTEALQTPTDFKAMRVGLYSALRGTIGGNGRYTTPEVQCDGFHALIGNSNTFGDMYRWDFTPQNSTIDGVYGGYQSAITRANFIIDGYNKCDMSDKSLFTDAEMVSVSGLRKVTPSSCAHTAYSCSRSSTAPTMMLQRQTRRTAVFPIVSTTLRRLTQAHIREEKRWPRRWHR